MDNKLEKIIFVYELATQMLMPKSYQWKAVAEKMYEIAKLTERKEENDARRLDRKNYLC